MTSTKLSLQRTALIFGAGPGLSASLAHLLAQHGFGLALAARRIDKLQQIAAETQALTIVCDVTKPDDVRAAFAASETKLGTPDLVVFNPSTRLRGPLIGLNPAEVAEALPSPPMAGFWWRRKPHAACCRTAMGRSFSRARRRA